MIKTNLHLQRNLKIPDKLIYKNPRSSSIYSKYEMFTIFSTKGEKGRGILICGETNSPIRDDYNGPQLEIEFISASPRKSGFGKSLIEFAKNYSKKIGCKGYVCLNADTSLLPNEVPHLFYRKCGFSSLDKCFDRKLDKFIKNGQNATYKDFKPKYMFYPPLPQKEYKIITFIKGLLELLK